MVITLHLFSTPANARRLLDAMDDIAAGNVVELDPDKPAAAE
jgi:PHD/YefM family antitoxin component YafN of YafNO toxin-antitoxin module